MTDNEDKLREALKKLVAITWGLEPATTEDGCYTDSPIEKMARAALATPAAPSEPVALTDEAIEWAWRSGWRHCRDAEIVGAEAESEEWGFKGADVIAHARNVAQFTEEQPSAKPAGATRSEKMRDAGITRRPTWKSLPSDADDEPAGAGEGA